MASKAKVAPVNSPTLPRLELLNGYLAFNLALLIKSSLKEELQYSTHYWTDSMVSLQWIIGYIQQRLDVTEWQFVAGKENLVDLCSGGVSLVEKNNI